MHPGNQALQAFLEPLDADARRRLARKLRTSYQYLHQLASGHRRASITLCRRFEAHTSLTRKQLRPDLFA